MTNFDKSIIDQLISYGFELHSTQARKQVTTYEYTYYPKYMKHHHYNLTIHTHQNSDNSDHRLYICNNTGGSYKDCVYMVSNSSDWQRCLLREHIDKTFVSEIRTATIKSIIND